MSTTASRSATNTQLANVIRHLTHEKFSGCVQITAENEIWHLYLKKGEFIYATKSSDASRRINHLLSRVSQPPSYSVLDTLPNLMADPKLKAALGGCDDITLSENSVSPDYQIICWLVTQNYLAQERAISIIKTISRDAILSLVELESGTFQILPFPSTVPVPKMAELDISMLMNLGQPQTEQGRWHNITQKGATPISSTFNATCLKQSELQQHELQQHELRQVELQSSLNHDYSIINHQNDHRQKKYIIVCITDNSAVLSSLSQYLDEERFTIFSIQNSVKALMSITRKRPDLILLDVLTSEVDGYELCSLLRKHPKFKSTPIIIITGNVNLVERVKAKKVKASASLNKSFTRGELLQMIHNYLVPSS